MKTIASRARRLVRIGLWGIVALMLTGCMATAENPSAPTNPEGSKPGAGVTNDLEHAARLWKTQQARYEFTASLQCYCLPEARAPRLITVNNNRITAIRLEQSGDMDPNPPAMLKKTVSDWFEYLIETSQIDLATVTGTFDASTGFPVRVSVDRHPRMADDEFSVLFSNYQPRPE